MAPRSAQNGTAGPSRVADMRVKWMLRWVLDGRFHEAALRNKRGVESPQWAETDGQMGTVPRGGKPTDGTAALQSQHRTKAASHSVDIDRQLCAEIAEFAR